jgi:hypothetical protein
MKKSVIGLIVAGATLAGVIASTPAAFAITIAGTRYQNNDHKGRTATDAHWSATYDIDPYETNTINVTDAHTTVFVGGIYDVAEYMSRKYNWDTNYWISHNVSVLNFMFSFSDDPKLIDGTPVPWETDAISVIGSTILFVGGLWARNKFTRPLQK